MAAASCWRGSVGPAAARGRCPIVTVTRRTRERWRAAGIGARVDPRNGYVITGAGQGRLNGKLSAAVATRTMIVIIPTIIGGQHPHPNVGHAVLAPCSIRISDQRARPVGPLGRERAIRPRSDFVGAGRKILCIRLPISIRRTGNDLIGVNRRMMEMLCADKNPEGDQIAGDPTIQGHPHNQGLLRLQRRWKEALLTALCWGVRLHLLWRISLVWIPTNAVHRWS